jgi:uncharacterized protein (TIGR02996 family)
MTLTSPAAVGLFRAILEDPFDDVPRLLLADVLEEAGDGERAEFMRVQCELAKWERSDWLPEQKQELTEPLRRRERELFAEAYPALTSGLPGEALDYLVEGLSCRRRFGDRTAIFTFRRGFVASVTLTCADWCGAECQSCQPPGRVIFFRDCLRCHGTGRTGRHGPTLVQAAPIEGVAFSDVTVGRWSDGSYYLTIPGSTYDCPRVPWHVATRAQRSPAELVDPFCHGALAWARQEAGLPPLRP